MMAARDPGLLIDAYLAEMNLEFVVPHGINPATEPEGRVLFAPGRYVVELTLELRRYCALHHRKCVRAQP
jgi:hypothetical protein